MKLYLLVLAVVFLSVWTECNSKSVLTCYVMFWSVYRTDEGQFSIDDIDAHLCTHIIYAYTEINSTTWHIQSTDSWADTGVGNLRKLQALKRENPYLKILTSIGGWVEGSEKFSKMSADKELRKTFVQSVMRHLQRNRMDGLDIDWQYPTKRGGQLEDKDNFVTLLKDLRQEFDKVNYTLTTRLTGTRYAAEGYDLPAISDSVHFINLKAFSYHGDWDSKSGAYAALSSPDESSVEFSVDFFLEEGVDRKKLLLGLSSEGNALLLEKPVTDDNYFNQQVKEGFSGPWLDQKGFMGFNEICWELSRKSGWSEHWDDESSTPYAVKGNMFTSFDSSRSFKLKMELIGTRNLGGASIYSLDSDDFRGHCYDQKFILTYTAKRLLNQLSFQTTLINQEFP